MENQKLKEIGIVTACGLVGGLFAWLTGLTTMDDTRIFLALATAMLGGGIAAGVGVYLVANTDTSQLPKLVFFSILCGVSWQAVIKTGTDIIGKTMLNREISVATTEIKALERNSSDTEIQSAAQTASVLVEKINSIDQSEVKANAKESITSVVAKLNEIAPEKPQVATDALEKIATSAQASGNSAIRIKAISSLKELHDNPKIDASSRAHAEDVIKRLDSIR